MLLEGYDHVKVLSVDRLRDLFDELKGSDMIHPNKTTGELCIFRGGEMIGYIITIGEGELFWLDEDWRD